MERKIQKLYQWRDRYSKSEYPYKVIVNLFYELYTIHFLWDEISSIFSKGLFSSPKRYNNFPDAMNYMANIKREIQVREINPKLIELMESNLPACNQQFEQYKQMIEGAKICGADRIELYTEHYALNYHLNKENAIGPYILAAKKATELGLGINAGHDLNLQNLEFFAKKIPNLAEVSIGHALISDAIYLGLENAIQMYKRLL